MSAAPMFKIRLLRAMTFGTRRALPGVDVNLDAATAAELIRSGAGRLTDEADLGPLLDAVGPRRDTSTRPLHGR
jgi:hypothetical protein